LWGVVDIFLQAKRDGKAAKRFSRRPLRSNGGEPCKIVTDNLRRHGVALRELMPEVIHDTLQYASNRLEQDIENLDDFNSTVNMLDTQQADWAV
jgi:putative transposase